MTAPMATALASDDVDDDPGDLTPERRRRVLARGRELDRARAAAAVAARYVVAVHRG